MRIRRYALLALAQHRGVRQAGSRNLRQLGQRKLAWPEPLGCGHGPAEELLPLPSHENINFQFRGEFFNLFNHPQWSDPNVTFSNGCIRQHALHNRHAAGNVAGTADSRIIQLR